jgi:Leucine-rich repeat (LRR) protein
MRKKPENIELKVYDLLNSPDPINVELAFVVADACLLDLSPELEKYKSFWNENIGGYTESLTQGHTPFTIIAEINSYTHWDDSDLDNPFNSVFPDNLQALKNLEILRFANNQLTTIPHHISTFSKLQELDLSNNQITSLPDEIGNLSNLQTLILNNNNLTSLPLSLEQLENLKTISLANNPIVNLPESIKGICSV